MKQNTSKAPTPKGWAIATLKDLCVLNPKHPKETPDDLEVSFVPMAAVSEKTGTITDAKVRRFGEVRKGYTQFADGDVIFAKITPCMENGKAASVRNLKNGLACGTTEFYVFRQQGALNQDYLFKFIRQESYRKLARAQMQSGVGQARVPKDFVLETTIPVPPLAEQSRIVSAIESLQERSSRTRDLLSEVGPLIGKLRQSVLRSAFSGDLTSEWRRQNPDVQPASELLQSIRTERRQRWEAEQLAKYEAKGKKPPKNWQEKYKVPEPVDESGLPKLPEGWCWCRVGDLIESIDAGRSPTAHSHPALNGKPGVLKVSAVTWREFDPKANKALKDGDEIGDTPTPRAGDLLISRANTVELIGAVVLVKDDFPNLMLSDKTLRLNPTTPHIPAEYILYGLRSASVRDSFEANATGTSNSMRNLSQAKILEAPIALAPLDEQEAIVEVLVASDQTTTELGSGLASMESSLNRLVQSILSKAFRGELVPQDPRDEPASELRARIKAAREQAEALKKEAKQKKKGSKSKRATKSQAETTQVSLESVAFDLLLLLRAWDKPVSIWILESALALMQREDLISKFKRTRSSKRKPKQATTPIMKGMQTEILGSLVGGGAIKPVGDNGYELTDDSHLKNASQERQDRAAAAIAALEHFMKRRELDEQQARDAIAAQVGTTYEIKTEVPA